MLMNHYPLSIQNLIKNLATLPGIGEKTAERLTMHILRQPAHEIKRLADSMTALKTKLRLCTRCFSLSDSDLCRICGDPSRDGSLICVVEQPGDMASIEKSGAFRGLYHILGGALSPMDGIGPDDIRVKELVGRTRHGKVREIVLATSTSVEGESTASYISGLFSNGSIRITRIASGVPMGGDLKYVDQVTLKKAMEARHAI